jgi:DNA-binding MarR family transcriptional regulator
MLENDELQERAKRLIAASPALAREIVRQFDPKPKRLTDRQQQALDVLKAYQQEHGVPPTYKEAAEALGCSSTAAFYMLHRLQARGYVEIEPHQRRSIILKAA